VAPPGRTPTTPCARSVSGRSGANVQRPLCCLLRSTQECRARTTIGRDGEAAMRKAFGPSPPRAYRRGGRPRVPGLRTRRRQHYLFDIRSDIGAERRSGSGLGLGARKNFRSRAAFSSRLARSHRHPHTPETPAPSQSRAPAPLPASKPTTMSGACMRRAGGLCVTRTECLMRLRQGKRAEPPVRARSSPSTGSVREGRR
jgi:hypothetical protein